MNTPEPPQSSDSESLVVLLITPTELAAVDSAIWHYLKFLKHFKHPSPIQRETAQQLLSFQQRLAHQKR